MRRAWHVAAVTALACLAGVSVAWAAHPVAGGVYHGHIGKRSVSFRVSLNGKTMRWRGTATVGLYCPPFGAPGGPPAAVVLISRSPKQRAQGAAVPPLVRIRPSGSFYGARKGLYFKGKFTHSGSSLLLRIRIQDRECVPQRPRYVFRLRAGRRR